MSRAVLASVLLASPLIALHHSELDDRFRTNRTSPVLLPLPKEEDAFSFVVFGDRTGGPAEGIKVLADAVRDVNLLEPDLVMTVGDLVQGYNDTPLWLVQMTEFKSVMNRLTCPWFPVAGNHDIYWRGKGAAPAGEHEKDYELHFGPLWYAFRHKRAWFIALFSDEGDPATGEHAFDKPAAQTVSPAQFDWLASTLAAAKGAENVFLFLHHPRWLHGHYGDDWDRVHELLVKAGNVTAVFAGHIHRMRYDGKKDGIEYFTLATVGGSQDGFAAEAGYLHEYHVVTVRKNGLAVTAYPVGAALDPRAITGAVSEEVRRLADSLIQDWKKHAAFSADASVDADCELEIANPTTRSIEVTLTPDSRDSRWSFAPDHVHKTVKAGASARFALHARRPAGALDASFREATVDVQVDYLAEGLRVPLPERNWTVPLDRSRLPQPARPKSESVLQLDGKQDCLFVASPDLALPDGPFTIEGWLRSRDFREREGFINKTENAEFGLFVGAGKPAISVHLNGRYTNAGAREPMLATNRWYHLAGVFDGQSVRLYVDGKLVDENPASGRRTMNGLPLVLGADVGKSGSANSHIPGQIDELRISKVARYAGPEFKPSRRFETDDDTLLLLHMDGLVGPWVPDSSGRNVAVHMGGAPQIVPEID